MLGRVLELLGEAGLGSVLACRSAGSCRRTACASPGPTGELLRGDAHRAARGVVRDELPACSRCATTRTARARSTRAPSTRPTRGSRARLSFDPAQDVAAPYVQTGVRPRVAILREQGVNSQVEMAAAFHRAGFEAHDVHMTDLIAGRQHLDEFRGLVACGGFSYGDVLGAGEGWAKSILFNARLREQFAAFFARPETFTLGVCNGCQMLSALKALVPGAEHWPRFVRNRSEQFEGRVGLVEILPTPSLFFAGMAGTRHADRGRARRGSRGVRRRRRVRRLRHERPRQPALRGQPRQPDGNLSREPERLAAGHHRPHQPRWPRHHPDAASRARVPQRAELLAAGGVGRGRRLAQDVPQRPRLGGLGGTVSRVSGETDGGGKFTTQATLAPGASRITLTATVREAPEGEVIEVLTRSANATGLGTVRLLRRWDGLSETGLSHFRVLASFGHTASSPAHVFYDLDEDAPASQEDFSNRAASLTARGAGAYDGTSASAEAQGTHTETVRVLDGRFLGIVHSTNFSASVTMTNPPPYPNPNPGSITHLATARGAADVASCVDFRVEGQDVRYVLELTGSTSKNMFVATRLTPIGGGGRLVDYSASGASHAISRDGVLSAGGSYTLCVYLTGGALWESYRRTQIHTEIDGQLDVSFTLEPVPPP